MDAWKDYNSVTYYFYVNLQRISHNITALKTIDDHRIPESS